MAEEALEGLVEEIYKETRKIYHKLLKKYGLPTFVTGEGLFQGVMQSVTRIKIVQRLIKEEIDTLEELLGG